MRYAQHILMLLFICFILLPVILKWSNKEGYCADDFYKLIQYKMGDSTIKEMVTIGNNCNSDYYKMIQSKLATMKMNMPGMKFNTDTTICPTGPEKIKCIADFGTSIGDPLCCGQDGVLQDTRYVCPNTLKKCSNFKCGSAFGTCTN